MRVKTLFVAALAAALLWSACPARAQQGTDAQAEAVMRSCCQRLAGLTAYSFIAEVDRDYAYPTGDSVRISQTLTVSVAKPDRFRLLVDGDDRDMEYVYDGKILTAYDADVGAYGVMEGRGTTDATVRHVIDQYGVQAPLANLLYADPCGSMDLDAVTGRYLGLHMAAGRVCHHMIFFGQDMNWQIWVDEQDGLPRKLVVTDKSLPGWPQYTAVMTKWNTGARFPAKTFTFIPPKDARKIPVLPVGQGQPTQPGQPGAAGN
ncbi:DUF2092 domain-containing protein [Fundidesulfovibrio terrae]|uniref:DUF2092 domain-containing protein n=1 Tax=Fundidesulfovibrio terrae TaxID=2922866 RepID=UPI001FAEDC28|nr:DUF2092 domain-containing protein [Fundidesulfovibrio terrae]